jgi:hypothetical protein
LSSINTYKPESRQEEPQHQIGTEDPLRQEFQRREEQEAQEEIDRVNKMDRKKRQEWLESEDKD